jgi:small subunit ribosomal protein S17
MPKMVAVGVVASDKMTKTRRVEIPRRVKHAKYGKYMRGRTVCYVHDENNESHVGDTVEIVESRPKSKTKRWDLVRIVSRSTAVDVGALRAARSSESSEG